MRSNTKRDSPTNVDVAEWASIFRPDEVEIRSGKPEPGPAGETGKFHNSDDHTQDHVAVSVTIVGKGGRSLGEHRRHQQEL